MWGYLWVTSSQLVCHDHTKMQTSHSHLDSRPSQRTAGHFCLLKALPSRLPGVLPLQETFAKSRGRERKDPMASMLKSCSERDAHGATGVKSRVLGDSHSVNTPRQATSTAGSMETFWAALDLHHFTSHRLGRHRREPHRNDRCQALP